MCASIVISDLAWSTPENHRLFSELNLVFSAERAGLVGRNGVGKSSLLKLIAGELKPFSGKISVSGTLGVLRQTVRVDPDETVADLFGAREGLAILRRADRGEASLDDLTIADWTLPSRLTAALSGADLSCEPDTRLAALSGGQRTRIALAALVFAAPDFILLDEPTNNLDRAGRKAVLELLAGWRNGAIVVSHDRELLENMDAIVELSTLGAQRYKGGWSVYRELKALELAGAQRELADAEKRIAEVNRSAQQSVERKARKDSAGKKKGAKGDMPRIVLGGLKNLSEVTSGANARLAQRRRDEALEARALARERIETLQTLSVTIASTGLPVGKEVVRVDAVTAGYEPEHPILREQSLLICGPERIAITGPNGSGKSTLLALIGGKLQAWSGTVSVMTDFALLDQRVELLDPALSIRDNFLRINPLADENACRTVLARFLFRADAALQQVATLSGGQLLRAGLACVLGGGKPPALLMLDEPTNHLDIESIEAVEAGLRAYDGALLVVSHDEAFLSAIAISRRVLLDGTP